MRGSLATVEVQPSPSISRISGSVRTSVKTKRPSWSYTEQAVGGCAVVVVASVVVGVCSVVVGAPIVVVDAGDSVAVSASPQLAATVDKTMVTITARAVSVGFDSGNRRVKRGDENTTSTVSPPSVRPPCRLHRSCMRGWGWVVEGCRVRSWAVVMSLRRFRTEGTGHRAFDRAMVRRYARPPTDNFARSFGARTTAGCTWGSQ